MSDRNSDNQPLFTEDDLISVYTRGQALEDGVLVDVSQRAAETGFKVPVALTSGVWAAINDIPEKYKGIQDIEGRLHDVLWMAFIAARRATNESELLYSLIMQTSESPHRKYFNLKLSIGPGDEGEPVITILLPEED